MYIFDIYLILKFLKRNECFLLNVFYSNNCIGFLKNFFRSGVFLGMFIREGVYICMIFDFEIFLISVNFLLNKKFV